MKVRPPVLALLTAAAIFVCAGAPAIAAPALWMVKSQSGGTVYLFGTVHVLREGTSWRSPEMEAAMKSSSDLYLEIADPANQSAALAALSKTGFDPQHPLSTRISKDDVALLGADAKRFGLGSEAAFEPMRPWLAYMVVAMMPITHSGYTASSGVDLQIRKDFVAAGKPVYGLETIEQQMAIFADLPESTQVTLLESLLKKSDQDTGAVSVGKLVSEWLAGNQDALAAQMQTDAAKQSVFEQRILTDRNKAWAVVLAKRLQQPGTSFVSVGALHMVGPSGVPALLAAMGFAVTRVQTTEPSATASPNPAASSASQAPSAAASATPSPAASPTPIPRTIAPPPGWKAHAVSLVSGAFKADGMWTDPNRDGFLVSGHLDLPGITSSDLDTVDTLFHQGLVAGAGSKGTVGPSTHVKVCSGTQNATFTTVKLASLTEDVVLTLSDRAYLAEYVRRKDVPDDSAAIASLHSICAP